MMRSCNRYGLQVLAVLLLVLSTAINVHGQLSKRKAFLNTPYAQEELMVNRRVLPYPPIKEENVLYRRRVQWVIDIGDKKGRPKEGMDSLFNALLNTKVYPEEKREKKGKITNGESMDSSTGIIKAYEDASLSKPLTIKELHALGDLCEMTDVQNPENPADPFDYITHKDCIPFYWREFPLWNIDEEWIYDKERGVFYSRIFSIASLEHFYSGSESERFNPRIYYKYNDIKKLLTGRTCMTTGKKLQEASYSSWFEQRWYCSKMIKVQEEGTVVEKDLLGLGDKNPVEKMLQEERERRR